MTETQPQTQPQPLFMTYEVPAQRPTLPENFDVDSTVLVYENMRFQAREKRYRPATVIAKGRVWVTIQINDTRKQVRFRMDSQTDGSTDNYPWRFYTEQQKLWDDVRDASFQYVWSQGLRLEQGSPWRGQIVELARMLWTANNPTQVTEVQE